MIKLINFRHVNNAMDHNNTIMINNKAIVILFHCHNHSLELSEETNENNFNEKECINECQSINENIIKEITVNADEEENKQPDFDYNEVLMNDNMEEMNFDIFTDLSDLFVNFIIGENSLHNDSNNNEMEPSSQLVFDIDSNMIVEELLQQDNLFPDIENNLGVMNYDLNYDNVLLSTLQSFEKHNDE